MKLSVNSILMRKFIFIIFFTLTVFVTIAMNATIFPSPLKKGDKIAILAPSGSVKFEYVEKAADVLKELEYEPIIYPTTHMHNGQFSGTAAQRLDDLRDAFLNPDIRAILCARGGYGMVHNLDSLNQLPLEEDPKWVIGYSDISALHALLASKGIASIHASMARHIARGIEEPENITLLQILTDTFPTYTFSSSPLNHPGKAEGKLLGGNLAVIQALINTPYDIFQPGSILFIEDISEPIYKVERIMYQLRMAGILDNISGLIIGQFTDYKPDSNHNSMEEMLSQILAPFPALPVAFNAPIGHVSYNVPLVISSQASLEVTPDSVTLSLSR